MLAQARVSTRITRSHLNRSNPPSCGYCPRSARHRPILHLHLDLPLDLPPLPLECGGGGKPGRWWCWCRTRSPFFRAKYCAPSLCCSTILADSASKRLLAYPSFLNSLFIYMYVFSMYCVPLQFPWGKKAVASNSLPILQVEYILFCVSQVAARTEWHGSQVRRTLGARYHPHFEGRAPLGILSSPELSWARRGLGRDFPEAARRVACTLGSMRFTTLQWRSWISITWYIWNSWMDWRMNRLLTNGALILNHENFDITCKLFPLHGSRVSFRLTGRCWAILSYSYLFYSNTNFLFLVFRPHSMKMNSCCHSFAFLIILLWGQENSIIRWYCWMQCGQSNFLIQYG